MLRPTVAVDGDVGVGIDAVGDGIGAETGSNGVHPDRIYRIRTISHRSILDIFGVNNSVK